jgi:flagellar protein FlaG
MKSSQGSERRGDTMFDTIQNSAQKIQGSDITIPSSNVVPLKPAAPTTPTPADKAQQSTETAASQKADKQVTQDLLDGIEKDMEAIHNTGLQFSVHENTGKIVVEVIDKTTHKTIREIPSKSIQDLADRMDEMLGILFDKKA